MLRDTTVSLVWLLDAASPDPAPVSLRAVRDGLRGVAARYEIVLVTQTPAQVWRRFAGADPYLRIVVPERGSDGAALTAGCAAAVGDYLLFVIGDDAPQWETLQAFVPYLAQSDVVTAFPVRPEPPSLDAAFTTAALGFLYGVGQRDPAAPAQIYRAELLRGGRFTASGPLLRVEVLAKARAQGAVITEVAVSGRTLQAENALSPAESPAALISATPTFDFRLSTFDYSAAVRLWLHLRSYRPPWIVRETRPTLRPPSEYVAGGVALAVGAWVVQHRLATLLRARRA